jgi:hypothetical protein
MRKVIVSIPEIYTSYVKLEIEDDVSDGDIKERAKVLFEEGDYLEGSLDSVTSVAIELWDVYDDTTVTCKCGEATSKDTDCSCFHLPCADDEGMCEHLRGCLHGECECECEF